MPPVSPRKKALLLEVGGSHQETLFTQICFLKWAGYEVTLVTIAKSLSEVSAYKNVDHFLTLRLNGGFLQRMGELLRLRRYIVDAGIIKVIFNTAQNEVVRMLCLLPLPRGVGLYGTLHNVAKLRSSLGQQVISRRLKGYFLLAEYLVPKAQQFAAGRKLAFEVYHPMFFPPVKTGADSPLGELRIVIPGTVENSRRDYAGIIEAFAALPQKPAIRFLFLGNAFHLQGNGPELQELARQLGVESHFRFWKGFVDNTSFHREVAGCNAIMLGIHPHTPHYEDYTERQISGSWNLAFGYQKPLLMPVGFRAYPDFESGCLFYEPAQLGAFLAQLPEQLQALPQKPFTGPRWDFETMAQRYINFIERK